MPACLMLLWAGPARGGAVVTRRTDLFATPGRYGWDGGYGTSGHLDPAPGGLLDAGGDLLLEPRDACGAVARVR